MIYVWLECNQIQDFVFSSRRLRGIRNGSRVVDAAIQEAGDRVGIRGGTRIRALGGVIVASFDKDRKCNQFLQDSRRIFRRYGLAAEHACVARSSVSDFYADALQPLLQELRVKKDCPERFRLGQPSTVLAATCDASGRGAATGEVRIGNRFERANYVERVKWAPRLMQQPDASTRELVEWTDDPTAKTVEAIAAWKNFDESRSAEMTGASEERLVGIVFADVNGLGRLLKQVAKDQEKYEEFAVKLQATLAASLKCALRHVLRRPFENRDLQNPAVPFQLLFLGGDDLCYAVCGAYALPLTQKFIAYFEKCSKTLLAPFQDGANGLPERLTISAGVVVAPYKYPILSFRRLGQGLEANAKRIGWAWTRHCRQSYPPSLVDFHLVKNDTAGGVEDVRRMARTAPDTLGGSLRAALFGGPYLASPPGNGQPHPEDARFLPLIKLLKAAESIAQMPPTGKVKALRMLFTLPGAEQRYREWYNHLDGKSPVQWDAICEQLRLPKGKDELPLSGEGLNTPLLDAIELAPLAALAERWKR